MWVDINLAKSEVWCLKECQIIKIICFKNPQLIYQFFETCTFNLSLCHMIQELKNCSIQLFLFSNFFPFFLMMQSARVEGNPWVLYSEERYQKFLAFLEEVSEWIVFYGLSEVSKPNIEFKWHLRLVNVWYVNTESMCSMYSVIIFQKKYSFQGDYFSKMIFFRVIFF